MPKRKKSSEGQDYISNLPDFIIGHILSFLSTKDAVRTSALSKRWIYMWTFVTKLDFRDVDNHHHHSDDGIKQFSNFVSRVLLHINHASIQNFYLSIHEIYDAYYTNQWLSAILNRGVKHICVNSFRDFNFSSHALFQSPSLEILVFRMRTCCIIEVPAFSCLPSLKFLSLDEITFTHYSSDKLKELTLKLPLLRTYKTHNCIWSGVKSVTLEAPLLEEVTMSYSFIGRMPPAKIKFCASHLTKFVYHGYMSSLSETILVDGHITSADIFLCGLRDTSVLETWVSLRRLLSLFTNTECLVLHFIHLQFLPFVVQCIAQVEHHLAGNPAFGMLGYLRLYFVPGEVLLSFLLKSPCLKTLVLQMDDSDEKTQNFAIVPDCFLSTLKVVKFEHFLGCVCELSFAKFVMENAIVLERISFLFHYKLTCSEVEKIKEKLLLFKKNSSTVNMEFSPPMSVEHKKVEERPNSHVEMLQAGPSRPRRQLAKPSWMNDYVCNV